MSLARITTASLALVALALLAYWLSRPAYPRVSETAYQCATALYAVCNQEASERLPQVTEVIAQASARGALPAAERDWLQAIVATAEAGAWQDAAAECREMLECQVAKDVAPAVRDGSAAGTHRP